jgi:hypothetical protein
LPARQEQRRTAARVYRVTRSSPRDVTPPSDRGQPPHAIVNRHAIRGRLRVPPLLPRRRASAGHLRSPATGR